MRHLKRLLTLFVLIAFSFICFAIPAEAKKSRDDKHRSSKYEKHDREEREDSQEDDDDDGQKSKKSKHKDCDDDDGDDDDKSSCALYPIALSAQSLEGVSRGDKINVYNGNGPGQFGWLTWTGSRSTTVLAKSLKEPGNSHTYINPDNSSDHSISVGDWVKGSTGIKNSSKVRDALDELEDETIVLPVWDITRGKGSHIEYRVSAFASVILGDYKLSKKQRITATFLKYAPCGGVSSNQAPVVNAGADISITVSDAATLQGSATDDGLPEGSTLNVTWSKVSGPGTVVFANTSSAETTASFDTAGDYVLQLAASDGELTSDDKLNVTVTEENRPPAADNKSVSLDEDTSVDVLLSGSDPDNDSLTFSIVNNPASGTLSGTAPNFTYTPNGNYNGSDSFTYKASDGFLESSEATVSIVVNPVNDAPIASGQSVSTLEDTALNIVLAGSDLDEDSLTYNITVQPEHGSLTGTAPDLTYTPDENYNGVDSFVFTVSDGAAVSDGVTVNIEVTAVNDAPTASEVSASVDEDGSVNLELNGNDVDGDALTFNVISEPQHGSLSGNAPSITYTPEKDFNGTDSFVFNVSDGTLASGPVTQTVTVVSLNDAPVADGQSLTIAEDNPLSITLSGSDVDEDALSFSVSVQPANGTLSGTAPDLTYTPTENFNGTDSFTYVASDGTIDSAPASVGITVTAVNDSPTATAVDVSVDEDGSVTITLNANDPDNDPLTYNITEQPQNGILSGTAPELVYTPAENFNGTDSFTFTVTDGEYTSDTATQVITVNSVNDAPVVDAGENVLTDITGSASLSGTVSDDSTPEGATLSTKWSKVSGPGTATFGDASSTSTTASFDAGGVYVLRLTANDTELSSSDEVSVTVNTAPVVDAGADLTGVDNQALNIDATVADDGVPEALEIAWSKLTGPGIVVFSAPNSVDTTATFAKPGSYVLMLSASDTRILSADTINVVVDSSVPNAAPVVSAGADQVVAHTDYITLEGAVSDDNLPVGSTLAVEWTQISGPTGVTFSVSSAIDAKATFPESGTYELQISATDGALSATDKVVLTVNINNLPPVVDAGADQNVTGTGVTLNGTVSDDGSPQPANLQVAWEQVSGTGSAMFENSAVLKSGVSFTEAGTYTLRLTANDGGSAVSDDVVITIQGNQPPVVDAGPDKTEGVQVASSQPVPDPVIPQVEEAWLYDIGVPGISGLPSGTSSTMVDWHSLTDDGSNVYGAGYFNYINNVEVQGIGRWDGCEWHPITDAYIGFIREGSSVHSIDYGLDNLFVGGGFLKDVDENGFKDVTARWDGERWQSWNFQLLSSSVTIYDIAVMDDAVYIGGSFMYQPIDDVPGISPVSGVSTSSAVIKWTTNGWEALGDAVLTYYGSYSADIHTIEPVKEGTNTIIYAGGYRIDSTSGDGTYANLARWDGSSWTTIGPEVKNGSSGRIWDIEPAGDGSLYVAGEFTKVGTKSIANIAKVHYDETAGEWVWEQVGDGLGLEVSALTMHKGKLYAGGKFNSSGYEPLTRIAMWDGTNWLSVDEVNGAVGGWVRSLHSTGDGLYVGGNFTTAGGQPSVGIARRGVPKIPEIAAPAPVTVYGSPSEVVVTPTVSTECCKPMTVTFNVDGGDIEYTTVISNTPTAGTEVNFTNSYAAGSHLVAITAYSMETLPVTHYTRVTVLDPAVITLDGSITDDGLPSGSTNVKWTQVDGPSSAVITDNIAPVTAVSFSDPGTYVMKLTGFDTELTAQDEMIVTIYGTAEDNQAPSVSAGLDQSIVLYESAGLTGQAVDDGLPAESSVTLQWSKVAGPGTATFDDDKSASTTVSFDAAGTYTLRLTATDTQLSSSDDVVITVENFSNNPPVVEAGEDQVASVSFSADLGGSSVSDDGVPYGILNSSWSTVSGPEYVSFTYRDGSWNASFYTNGTYVLRLTADDGMSSAYDEVTVTVYPEVETPSIAITSPGDSERITEPTDFIGTVASDLLDYYALEYRSIKSDQEDDENWIVASTGTTAVTEGVLGSFDPTLLLNGLYEVRVRAVDVLEREEVSEVVPVIVDGNMKVGHFTVSFKDLSVPLTGIPIEVIRTYDSRDKEVGDFGAGWNLSLSDIRVQKNRPMGLKWKQEFTGFTPYGGLPVYSMTPDRDRIVTIVFPDGQVFRFKAKFNPQTQNGVVIYAGTIEFEAMEGTHGTLTIEDPKTYQCQGQLAVYDPFGSSSITEGNVDLIDLGTMEAADPKKFRFTTQEGLTFILHEDTGVEKVIDANGNEVQYTDNGIFHSNGKSVQFQRDAQGRIEAIVDPNGKALYYYYNTDGDLYRFVDRALNGTKFTYTGNHQLEDIIDPRGVRAVRCEYDSDGRLISQTDAYGNAIEMSHDLPNRREVITDRLGNSTVHEYDSDGNVVKTIDALGGITRYTYDSWGNELSKTDPMTNTTYWTYDEFDNKVSTTDPLGNTTYYTFDEYRNQTSVKDPLGNITTNIYAEGNRLEYAIDANGTTTRYGYGSKGQLTSLIDAHTNASLVLSYNASGNMSSLMDINGVFRYFAYDEAGNQTGATNEWINPLDASDVRIVATKSEFNASGQVTNRIDANGVQTITEYNEISKPSAIHVVTVNPVDSSKQVNSTYYTYNSQGSETEMIDSDGAVVRKVYDAENRLVAVTDRYIPGTSAIGTVTEYDKLGRVARVDRVTDLVIDLVNGESSLNSYSDILSISYNEYDAAGRRIAMAVVTGISTNFTQYEYDAAGRNVAIIDDYGKKTEFEFDDAGRQVLTRDALQRETTFEFDNVGRQIKTIFHDGTFTEAKFDALGRKVAETDQGGKVKNFEFDNAGRIVAALLPAVENPATGSLERPRYEYKYTQYGALNVIRDPLGRETGFTHDELGRTLSRTLPMGQSESKEYNANGRLAVEADFKGQKTEYLYDSQGRVTNKLLYAVGSIDPDEGISFIYDSLGRLASATRTKGAVVAHYSVYTYDIENRIASVKTPEGTVVYEYDSLGRRIRTAGPHTETLFNYDDMNRLATVTSIADAGNGLETNVSSYAYTDVGSRSAMLLPNNVLTSYQYDNLNRLTQLSHVDEAGKVLGSYSYTLAADGRRTSVQEAHYQKSLDNYRVSEINYTYDDLNRLVQEDALDSTGSGYSGNYQYDMVGNRLKRTVVAGGEMLTTVYEYNKNDQLVSESNTSQIVAIPSGGHQIAAASTGAGLLGASKMKAQSSGSRFRDLPSVFSYWAFVSIPVILLIAFLVPIIQRSLRLSERRKYGVPVLLRSMASVLSVMFFIGLQPLQLLAQEADLYSQLEAQDWGKHGAVTTYQYDANGSMTEKHLAEGSKKVDETFEYNLENRLVKHVKTTDSDIATEITVSTTEYLYNHEGIKVSKSTKLVAIDKTTSAETVLSDSSESYLIDAYNHTGYAQVLEEVKDSGSVTSYTISDDVIAQTSVGSSVSYLLYDGHGSTRQLADALGEISGEYSYDAYGLMLGQQAGSQQEQATKLLYCGEQFDTSLQQYNLRARHYDPSNGRFNRVDPFSGSQYDPQSLHKYAYCHSDPVNCVDPSGEMTLLDVNMAFSILGLLLFLTIPYWAEPLINAVWIVLAVILQGTWRMLVDISTTLTLAQASSAELPPAIAEVEQIVDEIGAVALNMPPEWKESEDPDDDESNKNHALRRQMIKRLKEANKKLKKALEKMSKKERFKLKKDSRVRDLTKKIKSLQDKLLQSKKHWDGPHMDGMR